MTGIEMRHILHRIVGRARAVLHAIPTIVLARFGRTSRGKWANETSLSSGWIGRTVLLASFIPDASSVLELGAGRRTLERYLPPACSYVASDLVDRGPGTIVCDLNSRPLVHFPPSTAVVFGGVLEYLIDPRTVLEHVAASADMVILSYATKDVFTSVVGRRSNGWVNDFSERQLEELFNDLGFTARAKTRWEGQLVCRFDRIWPSGKGSNGPSDRSATTDGVR